MQRAYASVLDVLDDLELDGAKSITNLTKFVFAASRLIDKVGTFFPVTETKVLDGTGKLTLWVEPLLSVSALTLNGTPLTDADYVLKPQDRLWEHGPYTEIALINGGVWPQSNHNEVEISGQWGLYDDALDLGTTCTQTDGESTAQVGDASGISPGVMLRMGSEHEIVTDYDLPITINTTLVADVDDIVAIWTLSAANAVKIGEIVRCGFEQGRVIDVNSTQVLVKRGWNATERAAHVSGTAVEVYRKFKVERAANGTTAVAHTAADVYRLLPPYDVRYLCEQIAALMFKKGQGGFAGKTGNTEMGEVFYHSEFPKDPIKSVMNNYRIVTI